MHLLLAPFVTALRAIRRNLLRSALTCLGIIIAVAAVISMVEIGNGSNTQIQNTISSLGAAMLLVYPNAAANAGINQGAGSGVSLTPEECSLIERECPAVRRTAPIVGSWGQVVYQDLNWQTGNVIGSTPAYFDVHEWQDFSAGTSFTDEDVDNAAPVCLIGQTIVDYLFGDASPIGQEIHLRGVGLKVVGVLGRRGDNLFGHDQDDILVAPWTTVKYRINGGGGTAGGSATITNTIAAIPSSLSTFPSMAPQIYPATSPTAAVDNPVNVRFGNVNTFIIAARSLAVMPAAIEQITALLRQHHHLTEDQDDNFVVLNLTEIGNTLTSSSRIMTQLLLCVATISLIVGGVGIMNIMMVSVTERTREIGLRMAVGAKGRDILRQFLIEAVVLSLLGGVIGLVFGRATSIAVTAFMHWPTEPSVAAAIAALGVSGAVGIIFGFYPAWKASRLDPIEALRYE